MTATTFMVLTNVNKFAVVGFGIFVLGEARSWQARPRWSEKAPVFCDSSRRAPPRLAALEALGALEAPGMVGMVSTTPQRNAKVIFKCCF